MPRETIHPTHPADPDQAPPFAVTVGWERDHYVQVGIQVRDRDSTLPDQLYGPDLQAAIGQRLIELVDSAGWQSGDHPEPGALGALVRRALIDASVYVERDGIWTDLNRQQINDLIRHLRRARDAAYGRDE